MKSSCDVKLDVNSSVRCTETFCIIWSWQQAGLVWTCLMLCEAGCGAWMNRCCVQSDRRSFLSQQTEDSVSVIWYLASCLLSSSLSKFSASHSLVPLWSTKSSSPLVVQKSLPSVSLVGSTDWILENKEILKIKLFNSTSQTQKNPQWS